MLSPEEQDKKLVKEYKKTNKLLRKQLQSLNEQIDQLIIQKSNRIGLDKLPKVQKQITDAKVIHYQVENLKKRLEHIKHDNNQYKQKVVIDWVQKFKQLEKQLQAKINQKEEIKKKVKVYEKKLNQEKSLINFKKEQQKLLEKIQAANLQLARVKKVQRQLNISISIQQQQDNKKTNIIQKLETQKQQLLQRSKVTMNKVSLIQQKGANNKYLQISETQWQRLKQNFLQLKQSKQQQQMYLYQQNDRLRKQIKFLNQQLKVKKTRVDVVKRYNNLQPEKKLSSRLQRLNQRNTIDATNLSENKRKRGNYSLIEKDQRSNSVRYRNKIGSEIKV